MSYRLLDLYSLHFSVEMFGTNREAQGMDDFLFSAPFDLDDLSNQENNQLQGTQFC